MPGLLSRRSTVLAISLPSSNLPNAALCKEGMCAVVKGDYEMLYARAIADKQGLHMLEAESTATNELTSTEDHNKQRRHMNSH